MSKINLQDIGSGYNLQTVVNNNNDFLEEAFSNTVSRDGSSPNHMLASLDMNSQKVVNLGSPESGSDAARFMDLTASINLTGLAAPALTGNTDKALFNDGTNLVWRVTPPYISTTAAEALAGVTIVDFTQPAYSVARYGVNTTPNTTDMTTAIQAAINAGALAGVPGYLPGWMKSCKITAPLTITASRSGLVGDGSGLSQILAVNTHAITVSANLQFVHVGGLSIACGTRWTTTPHGFLGLSINGGSASQVYYSRFDDIFLDGFEANLIANGVAQCVFTRIDSEFSNRGMVNDGLSINSFLTNSSFVGAIGSSTTGVQLGDGTSATEGWMVSNNLIFGFNTSVHIFAASNNQINDNILDFFSQDGILVQSGTLAATNNGITNNYIAATGGSASSGIRLLSSVVSSDPRGNRIDNNDITVYSGSALSYGILVDGTNEQSNSITNNHVKASTIDCSITAGLGHKIIGNTWLGTGIITSQPIVYLGNSGASSGLVPTVASAAALTIPVGPTTFYVSGTTNITSIVTTGHIGDTIKLIFSNVLTVTDGSNLKLGGNFVASADDVLTLFCDGVSWYEVSRSAN